MSVRRRGWIAGLVLAAAAAPLAAGGESAGPAGGLDYSALMEAARVSGPLDFCGEPVPLEDPDVRERMEREMLLVLWDAPQVILWIKRAGRYMGPIEESLRKTRLPMDLKYVPIAESSLRPHAGSPKGAMGFWQFIAPTGRKYGLTVDSEKDQRRNLADSTEAALAYLADLRAQFGSWSLAVAAYNMGENGLAGEIAAQETRDYYRLYLPLETQRYLFRILAAKLILSDPARYGFRLAPEELYPPQEAETVTVELARETPVLAVARAADTDLKMIKDLNPEVRGYRLAPGRHTLSLPRGSASGFHERLARVTQRMDDQLREVVYLVREGDTLSEIAERHRVSVSDLRSWNRLDPKKMIQPGMRLVIQTKTGAAGDADQ